jgi:hypothetical protein
MTPDMNHRRRRARRASLLAALLLCGLCVSGCTFDEELPAYYGRHQLPGVSASVNGTDVLAGMFEEAGHQVFFRTSLVTQQMEAADVVVWFPDDYAAPKDEVVEWFDTWLAGSPNRTLILVGRDYDAEPQYWLAMSPQASPDNAEQYKWRKSSAEFANRSLPKLEVEDRSCFWFRYEQPEEPDKSPNGDVPEKDGDDADEPQPHKAKPPVALRAGKSKKVEFTGPIPFEHERNLRGPWAEGIDVAKTEIVLRTRLIPAGTTQPLLVSGSELLASRLQEDYWENSQLLLVPNGSYLLNLPLVNHEHRKLAGKLIEAAGEPANVVFLESGPGGPPIDPPYADNSLWTLFGAWPLNAILLQLAVAGVIFCFARWPIFGRPQEPPVESTSDFARHVTAVGRLLSRTKDRALVVDGTAAQELAMAASVVESDATAPLIDERHRTGR